MVGKVNEAFIAINGKKCKSLIDSGSMVSTISETFLGSLKPTPELKAIDEFILSVTVAEGSSLPYSGYVEVSITTSFSTEPWMVPLLVVKDTEYNRSVPVIIGTNILRYFKSNYTEETSVSKPSAWEVAFSAIDAGVVSLVKATNKHPIKVSPMSVVTLSGICKSHDQTHTAVTENIDTQSEFGVCPRVVNLKSTGKCRIPVRIFNMTSRVIHIKPKSVLCGLNKVSVVRPVDIGGVDDNIKIPSDEEQNKTAAEVLEQLGVSLQHLQPDIRGKLENMIIQWKSVFSTGHTDLGYTNLVEHEIKLNDETPFRDPYRRIPPCMFDEVKEHIREMLEAGAIRESTSPYSSNVVLVRKSDGSLRFCIDFRTLNRRTLRDQKSIPRIAETLDCLAGTEYYSKLDLRSAYWQCAMKESDIPKTAFDVGPLGFYECQRLPFGLVNACSTF